MTTSEAIRSTVADIDLDAIASNVEAIRARSNADVIAVVKADAYGHGAQAVAQDLLLVVWDVERARAISEAASVLRRTARVHFKVDTGLTRLGAPMNEAAGRYRTIASLPHIEIDGIFTHFATADEPDTSNDRVQFE